MLWTLAGVLHAGFSALCVALVAAFLLLVCTPVLHQPVRARLRPLALQEVEQGLSWVLAAQRWQHPLLTSLFMHSSHSVSVTFYASFLPTLFWLGLPELGRDLVLLMTLSLFVGNAIKDLVCSPRPLGLAYGRQRLKFLAADSSDEEVQLNAKEYGLPSSHTLNSLCLNFFAVWYFYDRGLIASGTALTLYGIVFLWVTWIAASRLYLGLHTPVDILAGALAGLAVLVCFISVEGLLSRWILHGPAAVLHAALASLVLLRLHPRPLAHTPSFEFTTSFMGAMFGVVAGMALTPHAHQPGVQLAQLWSSPSSRLAGSRLLWALRRLGICSVIVAAMKESSKPLFLAVLPLLYRFFPLPIRRLWQPPVHNLAAPPTAAAGAQHGHQEQDEQQRRRRNGRQHADSDSAIDEAVTIEGQNGERREGVRTRRSAAAAGAAAADKAGGSKQAGQATAPAGGLPGALPPQDPRLAELPHDAKGRPWDVVVTARFFSYAAIGVAVAGVSPRVLDALGW
ncbi:lipid phosphate phosphatase delta [Chlorella sorokiniana]|uniref:Lipid phosphate phosphatase delta n=1 Tax=Chlorella sorokiniana TaxID=3076 RepID=A0A2P6TJD9_CHLSO|nr:lipid phosphate phosphatase delta [Chlorella sorokiniana]|eukprot:PRW39349.1 lipid phosphate phosphatase delta [Chlorella sorokiniana]